MEGTTIYKKSREYQRRRGFKKTPALSLAGCREGCHRFMTMENTRY